MRTTHAAVRPLVAALLAITLAATLFLAVHRSPARSGALKTSASSFGEFCIQIWTLPAICL